MLESAVTFAVVLPGLMVAHHVADHVVQTHHQATRKHLPGWSGRLACARHVATYTLTTAATVALLWWLFALPITPLGFVLGQVVSAVTHYVADRRAPLEWLVNRWPLRQMGKAEFYRLGRSRRVAAFTEPPWPEAGVTCTTTALKSHPVVLRDESGSPVSWDNPSLGTGAYALDQSWHWAWLFVAALLTALV